MFLDTHVNIEYTNSNNESLLDPANTDGIKSTDIEIYYLEKGNKRRIYDAKMDMPKNFQILKLPDGKYYLSLAASYSPDNKGISTTYIEIKNRGTDTLTGEIYIHKGITEITKAWYNGVLKWDGNGESTFTVVK